MLDEQLKRVEGFGREKGKNEKVLRYPVNTIDFQWAGQKIATESQIAVGWGQG